MSFVYGMLYLSLTAYSIVFGQIHGMAPGISGLPYIGMIIGVMIGFVAVILTNPGYVKKLKANNNIPVPEWRLFWPMLGGVSFTIGLFWFGWTGYTASIPWIVPTLAGLCLGFGIYTIFLQLMNYIIDSYLMFAASAIAGNTMLRSLCGFAFPMFATQMYDGKYMNNIFRTTLRQILMRTRHWHQLGNDSMWLLLGSSDSHAFHLLLLRQENSRQKQVRTCSGSRTG